MIKAINKTRIITQITLFLSFVFASVISARFYLRGAGASYAQYGLDSSYNLIYTITLILTSVLSWIIFEMISKLYFNFLVFYRGHCKYTDIPALRDRLRYYYIVRNIILGAVSFVYLVYPTLYIKGDIIFQVAVTTAAMVIFYFDVRKNILPNANGRLMFDMAWPYLLLQIFSLAGNLL